MFSSAEKKRNSNLILNFNKKLSVSRHDTFNPNTPEAEVGNVCEFQTSQGYIIRPWFLFLCLFACLLLKCVCSLVTTLWVFFLPYNFHFSPKN